MIPSRAPIVAAGQLYLNEEMNEYLIVTGNTRGQIAYAGPGFRGNSEIHSFIERFQPVDPADVESSELKALLAFCVPGTKAAVGFIEHEEA